MKTLLLFLALATTAVFAQDTTYPAVRGSIHPYPYISATLFFGPSNYSDFALTEVGSGFDYLKYYTLPDGTSANLTVVSSSKTTIGYLKYQVNEEATGTDSAGAAVDVFATYTYHVGGSGRYTTLVFDSGSMEVKK